MSENYGSIGDSGSQLARMQNGMAAREDRQIVKVGLTHARRRRHQTGLSHAMWEREFRFLGYAI